MKMKKIILISCLFFAWANRCYAGNFEFPPDSNHVWYVAKEGNDNNTGHAQQHPVHLSTDAKLTIGTAVTASVNGDTIIIEPGDYVETVNLDSANKSVILAGVHRDLCRIMPSNDDALILEENTQVYNLSCITTTTAKQGIDGGGKSNIVIDNCYAYGPYDGIYLSTGGTNNRITNTYAKSTFDGGNIGGPGLFIDNCIFETDGAYTSSPVSALTLGDGEYDDAGAIIRNSIFRVVCTVSTSQIRYGIKRSKGKILIDNCDLIAVTKTDATGDAYGLFCGFGTSKSAEVVVRNCHFYTASNGGTAEDIHLLKNSVVVLSNCLYDRSKVGQTTTSKIIDLSDAKGKVSVGSIKGVD